MDGWYVGHVDEIPERGRKVVRAGEHEIGVFRVNGALVAWHNSCAHRDGPVCQGRVFNRVREPVAADGTVRMLEYDAAAVHLVCPWHGYEYDLVTGEHPGNPRLRLRRATLSVVGSEIYVSP